MLGSLAQLGGPGGSFQNHPIKFTQDDRGLGQGSRQKEGQLKEPWHIYCKYIFFFCFKGSLLQLGPGDILKIPPQEE